MNRQLQSTYRQSFGARSAIALPGNGFRSFRQQIEDKNTKTIVDGRAFPSRIMNIISETIKSKHTSSSTHTFQAVDLIPLNRKTKVIATIGPTSNTRESFYALADAGINVVRLNMSHGDHTSHSHVVDLVREYNTEKSGNLAIMLDTKGPEVRSGDVVEPIDMKPGDIITFTIKEEAADGKNNGTSSKKGWF